MWAAWAWVRGLTRDRPALLWLAATLVVLRAMTKYFGAALIPLLIAYALVKRRGRPMHVDRADAPRPRRLVAYQIATKHLYGRGLLLDAGEFAATSRANGSRAAPPPPAHRASSFLGGGEHHGRAGDDGDVARRERSSSRSSRSRW
jgi:hypothetical protein